MSKKPVLVIMAAGMGSRYGGLKQIDPVDPYGNMIIDFSIYDQNRQALRKSSLSSKKPSTRHSARASASELRNTWM